MWVGVPILSGCGFCCWRGVACGPGASGGSLGVGFLGGSALGLRPWPGWGIGDSWVLFFLATACSAAGDACAGGRRLPAWRRTVPGLVRGGLWGSGGALLRVGVTAWAWGLGSWLVCRREHGLVHALWARLWCGGLRCNRGGVNGLYLGVLLSFVVWELTEWWGGVVFPLLWGLVGRPGCHGPCLDGPGPPALGRFGVAGGPMGSAGELAPKRGGVFCPLWCFPPPILRLHFSRSITPTHR